MRSLVALLLITACAHAPPPAPKPELAVDSAAALAGHWLYTTEVDWTYFLAIETDGRLHITLDRGKMGRCEQEGVLKPGPAKQTFRITYARNTCDHEHPGAELAVTITSYTGDDLVLDLSGAGADERLRYRRDKP